MVCQYGGVYIGGLFLIILFPAMLLYQGRPTVFPCPEGAMLPIPLTLILKYPPFFFRSPPAPRFPNLPERRGCLPCLIALWLMGNLRPITAPASPKMLYKIFLL